MTFEWRYVPGTRQHCSSWHIELLIVHWITNTIHNTIHDSCWCRSPPIMKLLLTKVRRWGLLSDAKYAKSNSSMWLSNITFIPPYNTLKRFVLALLHTQIPHSIIQHHNNVMWDWQYYAKIFFTFNLNDDILCWTLPVPHNIVTNLNNVRLSVEKYIIHHSWLTH